MTNGRLTDVLIEESYITGDTGIRKFHELIVWADPDMKDVIKSVEGVGFVHTILEEFKYYVRLDPRYDRDYVAREIEAQIKISAKEE